MKIEFNEEEIHFINYLIIHNGNCQGYNDEISNCKHCPIRYFLDCGCWTCEVKKIIDKISDDYTLVINE